MKVIIGTPAYGGMVMTNYLISMIQTTRCFVRDNAEFVVYTLTNESLINRGRNTIANEALKMGYEKLVFIDADMGWTYADLCAVCNSDKGIVGGTYPLKTLPICLNFNALPQHFEYFAEKSDKGTMYNKSLDKYKTYKEKCADVNGEVEVMHVPTGFMAININVLDRLKSKVATYQQRDHHTGEISTLYEFFPIRIKNNILESEDWAFCSIARENGIPVYLNTNVVLEHAGTYTFRP